MSIVFTSKGRLYRLENGAAVPLACGAIETYKKNLRDIQKKRDWKTTGQGAMFMGMAQEEAGQPDARLMVSAAVPGGEGRTVYTAELEDSTAMQIRFDAPDEPEQVVLRSKDYIFHDMDLLPGGGQAVVSCSEPGVMFEKNIGLVNLETADVELLTEGDSIDAHPFAADEHVILFDSRGLGMDANQQVVAIGPAQAVRLDRRAGELVELLADDKFEFLKPKLDAAGNLYCIKRPYKPQAESRMTALDVLLLPVRFLRAIFGWMNLFSKRYTGDSLRTGGVNPAKNKQKSEEQLFIEGNLVNADKALKENRKQGDQYAGIAPRGWVLMKYPPAGGEQVVRRGVMDYDVTPEGDAVCSNGKYLLMLRADGREEKLCEASLATAIRVSR